MSFDTVLAYVNVTGLVLGFIGGLLTCIYGLPNREAMNEASYIEMSETPRLRRYNCISRVGLGVIAIGFAMQLLPALHALPN